MVEARPDTGFPFPTTFLAMGTAEVRVPNFGQFDGVNDRFSYGDARTMLHVKMSEFESEFLERVLAQKGYMFSQFATNSESEPSRI